MHSPIMFTYEVFSSFFGGGGVWGGGIQYVYVIKGVISTVLTT